MLKTNGQNRLQDKGRLKTRFQVFRRPFYLTDKDIIETASVEAVSDDLLQSGSPLRFFRFAADNQKRQVALAHNGFGEAAHQEVHQAGAAVCAEYQ